MVILRFFKEPYCEIIDQNFETMGQDRKKCWRDSSSQTAD